MMQPRNFLSAVLALLTFGTALNAQRPMTARDLWSLGRVGAPALSPDGRQVAYTVTRYDLETFKSTTEIWVVPTAGGAPTLAATPGSAPSWSPSGQLADQR